MAGGGMGAAPQSQSPMGGSGQQQQTLGGMPGVASPATNQQSQPMQAGPMQGGFGQPQGGFGGFGQPQGGFGGFGQPQGGMNPPTLPYYNSDNLSGQQRTGPTASPMDALRMMSQNVQQQGGAPGQQVQQPFQQGLPLQQGLPPEVVQQWLQMQQGGMPPQPPLGQTPPGMQRIGEGPRQQPRSAAELAAMGYISEPMRNAPPPQQPPQKQDITAGLRAKAAGMTPQQMQSITQQMRAGAAGMTPEQQAAITAQMRKGPQPNNPLAQPQQVRPEDARMQAMRGLQQLGNFKRYMG